MKSIYQFLFLFVVLLLIAGTVVLVRFIKKGFTLRKPAFAQYKRLRKKNALITNRVFTKQDIANNILWAITYSFLFIVCAIQVYIIFWMFFSSFKDDIDMFLDMFGLPFINNLKFENYKTVLKLIKITIYSNKVGVVEYNMWDMAYNSVLIAVLLPIKSSVVAVSTAYVLSKYNFGLKKFLLSVNLFVIVMPGISTLASQLKIAHFVGTYDNLLMQTLLGAHPFGFNLLIYLSMFNAIDKAYMEAAQIDGAGHFTVFVKIMLPMIAPTVFVFYILAVLGGWSNYEITLIWLPSYPNLARGIYEFQHNTSLFGATMPQVLAGFIIISIPSIIFYLFNQRLIASKMIVGGLKG